MNFKILEKNIIKNALDYSKRHNIEFNQDFAAIKLMEEVGEFAQALLIHQKKCRESKFVTKEVSQEELGHELADVIGMAIVNAYLSGVDIERAIDEKWIHKKK